MKNRYSLGLFFVLSIPLIPINRLSISSRRPLSSVAFFAREARGDEGLRPFPFFVFVLAKKEIPLPKFDYRGFNGPNYKFIIVPINETS